MLLSTYYLFLSTFILAISYILWHKNNLLYFKRMYYGECYKNSH